ncbi:hypothetical protein HDU90_001197 [Geranomyces variabilis]|nr:hypothetical protein HDU90_001197 [Geranomyces variabilis]
MDAGDAERRLSTALNRIHSPPVYVGRCEGCNTRDERIKSLVAQVEEAASVMEALLDEREAELGQPEKKRKIAVQQMDHTFCDYKKHLRIVFSNGENGIDATAENLGKLLPLVAGTLAENHFTGLRDVFRSITKEKNESIVYMCFHTVAECAAVKTHRKDVIIQFNGKRYFLSKFDGKA